MSKRLTLFLSHNSADKPFVRKVADDLQSQGFEVWLDERKMRAGDSITDGIETGMSNYDVFLIFLSSKSVVAPWVKEELKIAIHNRIESSGNQKIIPILVDSCEIPKFLKDYIYVDFKDNSTYESSLNNLCDSLVFDDQLLIKYRDSLPSNAIVESISINADVFGRKFEKVQFREVHRVKFLRKTSSFFKELTIDGDLIEVNFTPGKLSKKQVSKSNWHLEMDFNREMNAGEEFEFEVFFELSNEFQYENSWFFRIDAPTKKLLARFTFSDQVESLDFFIRHIVTLGEVGRRDIPLSDESSPDEKIFEFEQSYPSYKDRYQFCWK